MPQPAISAEQYSLLVRERIAALRQLRLGLIRGAPQSAPHRFFDSIRILIGAIEKVFTSRSEHIKFLSASEEEKDRRTAFSALLTMKLLNDVQEQLFPFLEKLGSPHVPLAVLPAMQRIASEFETDVELYLFPASEHNFGFSGFRNLIETFIQKFGLIIADDLKAEVRKEAGMLPRWFVFLSFPYVVHDSALHLTPLLHELGHFADFELGIYKELLPIDVSGIEAANKLVDKICKMPLSQQGPRGEGRVGQILQREVIAQQFFDRCSEVIHSWVHELISDLLALRMGGPAYFYAFVTFAGNLGLEAKAQRTHPSPAIRIDFMVKELKELGYFSEESPEQIRSSLKEWENWIQAQKLDPEDDTAVVAYLAVKESATKLASAVRRHSASFSYGINRFAKNVGAIRNDLEAGIPPIDRPSVQEGTLEPCDFADILNGAWTTHMFSPGKLESLLDCPGEERRLRAVSVLNELVLKAIEATEILRKCRKTSEARA